MRLAEMIVSLQKASEGLLFTSESEYPYEVIHWETTEPLTEESFRQQVSIPDGTRVERMESSEFCDPDAPDPDWYGESERADAARFRDLMTLLRDYLSDLEVYRVGEGEVGIYILGRLGNCIIGLKTTSIET